MHWIDWLIVIIPLLIVIIVGGYTQQYVKGVSDFLTAGRVAGRYVIAVAGGEASVGLISVIAITEMYYSSGFGLTFWNHLTLPLGLLFSLTGYAIYRFRETRAMTLGQFLEMRYSRKFRIFAACLQAFSGILNYAIYPAVGARFLIYYLDLPIFIEILGWNFPTFGLIMFFILGFSVFIACLGGQITIMVTDCIQGILSYPMYMTIVIFILWKFSWSEDILPTLLDRPAGKSFLNPYDIYELRDFNLFFVISGIIASIVNRLSWSGSQGYNTAASSAHEQKMGGLLGTWRSGFSAMMIILLALSTYVYMNNAKFQKGKHGANEVNRQLTIKTITDVVSSPEHKVMQKDILQNIENAKPRFNEKSQLSTNSDKTKTIDNYKRIASEHLSKNNQELNRTFKTIHNQMLIPLTMREMLPIGITGIFCAIMFFLMISTDTTYMHSWGSILIQDIILPIRGKSFAPKQQLYLLRLAIVSVAIIAFSFSFFFAQLDYIFMFFKITGAIWLGGSGVTIILGLYWKKGTTIAAFVALAFGASSAILGFVGQKLWSNTIYPFLSEKQLVDSVANILETLSKPFNPYIAWTVTPDKYPINSQEIFFITLIFSVLLYVVISLLTYKENFNLDRLLHRGIYSDKSIENTPTKNNIKAIFKRLIGITPEYRKKDKILAWSVFAYSFIYAFLLCFIVPIIWNLFYRWPAEWWGTYFFIVNIVITSIVGTISTFWFAIGGILDLKKLFKNLKNKTTNILDDGFVIGHQSAVDIENNNKLEQKVTTSNKITKDK